MIPKAEKLQFTPNAQTNLAEATFKSRDKLLEYKLVINDSPSSDINVYYIDGRNIAGGFQGYMLKVFCNNWNNASLKVQCKTDNPTDIFSDTGDVFTSNELKIFYYQ